MGWRDWGPRFVGFRALWASGRESWLLQDFTSKISKKGLPWTAPEG